MPGNPSRRSLMSKVRRGFRGYPIITIAHYGPDDTKATKVAIGILKQEGVEEADILDRFHSDNVDVRIDERINKRIVNLVREYPGCSVVMADRIIGCPHEEGTDYPDGEECLACPWWHGRDRWTGESEFRNQDDDQNGGEPEKSKITVALSEIVDGLEMASDEITVYLDREGGELVWISEEVDFEEDGELEENTSDWQAEAREEARQVRDKPDRFLALPDKYNIHEWDMMRRFADRQTGTNGEWLSDAIHGSGAFRRFQTAVDRLGLRDAWFAFRKERYKVIAIDWCEEVGVAFLDNLKE